MSRQPVEPNADINRLLQKLEGFIERHRNGVGIPIPLRSAQRGSKNTEENRKLIFEVKDDMRRLWHFARGDELPPEEVRTLICNAVAGLGVLIPLLEAELERSDRASLNGAERGATQSANAHEFWAPWVEQFHALIAEGKAQANARAIVLKRMKREGCAVADSTTRKWLRK
jgi:hypothetical protein